MAKIQKTMDGVAKALLLERQSIAFASLSH
jgi:hypothetical protein